MDANEIAKIAQIASALEVSGYPKPGNVHRTRDFDDMEFEDFVISGIVIGDTIREACTDVDVETVDGTVTMRVPAGTQPGTNFKLSGHGAPRLGTE